MPNGLIPKENEQVTCGQFTVFTLLCFAGIATIMLLVKVF